MGSSDTVSVICERPVNLDSESKFAGKIYKWESHHFCSACPLGDGPGVNGPQNNMFNCYMQRKT